MVAASWSGSAVFPSRPGGGSRCAARTLTTPLRPRWPATAVRPRATRREPEVPDNEPFGPPNQDAAEEVIERLEWADGKQEETPHKRLRDVSRRTALTGGAAGIAAFILQA